MAEENERWLIDGDCTKCRRQKYCKKPCTRCKREFQNEISSLVSGTLDKMTGGAYSKIMESNPYRM